MRNAAKYGGYDGKEQTVDRLTVLLSGIGALLPAEVPGRSVVRFGGVRYSRGPDYLVCLTHERQHVVGQLDARRVYEAAARGLDGYGPKVTGLSGVRPKAFGTGR